MGGTQSGCFAFELGSPKGDCVEFALYAGLFPWWFGHSIQLFTSKRVGPSKKSIAIVD